MSTTLMTSTTSITGQPWRCEQCEGWTQAAVLVSATHTPYAIVFCPGCAFDLAYDLQQHVKRAEQVLLSSKRGEPVTLTCKPSDQSRSRFWERFRIDRR